VSYYTDVCDWHRAAGIPLADRPSALTPARLSLRCGLMYEEGREFWQQVDQDRPDLAEVAKEAADVIVTILGTMAEMGIPFDAVWTEVHRSNMAKVGPDGTVVMREDGKILKPEGWQAPDVAAVLAVAP
jgi:predicted HAD superfamily Cof-like phosphohydrolase